MSVASPAPAPTTPTAPSPTPAATPTSQPAYNADAHGREVEFRQLFELNDDKLIDDYSCALQLKSLLLHGRLYISDKNLCFYANIVGRKTTKLISFSKLVGIYKKSTAVVFSNALEIVTRKTRYFFTSFMFRDAALKAIAAAWAEFVGDNVAKVVVKPDGAEIFLRPSLPGDIPYVTGDEEERSSEDKSNATPTGDGSLTPTNGAVITMTTTTYPNSGMSQSMGSLPEGVVSLPATPAKTKSTTELDKRRRKSVDAKGLNGVISSPMGTLSATDPQPDDGSGGSPDGDNRTSRDKLKKARSRTTSKSRSAKGSVDKTKRKPDGTIDEEPAENPTGNAEWASQDKLLTTPGSSRGSSPSRGRQSRSADTNIPTITTITPAELTPLKPAGPSLPAHPAPPQVVVVPTPAPVPTAAQIAAAVAKQPRRWSIHPLLISKHIVRDSTGQPTGVGGGPDPNAPAELPTEEDKKLANYTEAAVEEILPVKPPINPSNCPHIDEDSGQMQKILEKEVPNFTVHQFWLLFYATPQFLEEFAKASEFDENWTVTEWKLTDDKCCLHRAMNYRIPLRNALGPKSTRIDSSQNLKMKNKYMMVYETCNISKDVPFGESFTVHDRWTIIQSGPNLKVTVVGAVKWKKSIWGLKGTIEKKAMEGSKASADMFFTLADPKIEQYTKERQAFLDRQAVMPPPVVVSQPAAAENNLPPPTAAVVESAAASAGTLSSDEDESDVEEVEDQQVIRSMQRASIQRNVSDAGFPPAISDISGRRSRAPSASHMASREPHRVVEESSGETRPDQPKPKQNPFVAIGTILATLPPNYIWFLGALLILGAVGISFGLWSIIFLIIGPLGGSSTTVPPQTQQTQPTLANVPPPAPLQQQSVPFEATLIHRRVRLYDSHRTSRFFEIDLGQSLQQNLDAAKTALGLNSQSCVFATSDEDHTIYTSMAQILQDDRLVLFDDSARATLGSWTANQQQANQRTPA